ncbi:hypothetical protein TRFO_09069 [Tritrichomonas foetus]|uniref:Uncharacterized protein n=1 Tax=Tritrichomonas foetus TaxID=1144522 RepID=A0A1J4JG88_9EUKA|nr:hypothetical protein TRFO_09069 [Tritrichomonas foetus]|eukprot:OHS98192.1 hypothetical protein TRFO_09069 [Tritrichomonas foetus]
MDQKIVFFLQFAFQLFFPVFLILYLNKEASILKLIKSEKIELMHTKIGRIFINWTYVCSYEGVKCSKNDPRALFIHGKYGRLGNNLIQFIKTLSLAIELKIKYIFIPDFWFLPKSLQIVDISVIKGNPKNLSYLSSIFYYLPEKYMNVPEEYLSVFRSHFVSVLPKPDIDNDTLVIHIRSGDIMGKNPHGGYWQPPYCFYEGIIKNTSHKNVFVMCEDFKNPVVPKIKNELHIDIHTINLLGTVSNIYHAKSVVYGIGTFVKTILYLSNETKDIYCLKNSPPYKTHYNFTTHFFEINQDYLSKVTPWGATQTQKDFMVNYTCTFPNLRNILLAWSQFVRKIVLFFYCLL